jgi:RNA polymerase sigma factor (sigma-70 family)
MSDASSPPRTAWEEIEEQHIERARRDSHSFGVLYDHYMEPVYRYLLSRTGSQVEAQDLTAQTFLAAMQAFPRFKQGNFAAWLFAIARRKWIDQARRRRPEEVLTEDLAQAAPDLLQQVIHKERSNALRTLLASLPEEEQELVRLRYVAELSYADIGVLLQRSEDAVKKSIYRLVTRLQRRMEEIYG